MRKKGQNAVGMADVNQVKSIPARGADHHTNLNPQAGSITITKNLIKQKISRAYGTFWVGWLLSTGINSGATILSVPNGT